MTDVKTPPVHPGEHLGHAILCRGITILDAAHLMGVKPVPLRRIITGHCKLSPEIAQRLELAGVGTARDWLDRQAAYSLWKLSVSIKFDVKPFPPEILEIIQTGSDSEQFHYGGSKMQQITADTFYLELVNAFNVPADLRTGRKLKPFVMFTDGGCVKVAKPDGKRRSITPKEARAFFERYQNTGSITASHYREAGFNASYLLAALKHIQNAA